MTWASPHPNRTPSQEEQDPGRPRLRREGPAAVAPAPFESEKEPLDEVGEWTQELREALQGGVEATEAGVGEVVAREQDKGQSEALLGVDVGVGSDGRFEATTTMRGPVADAVNAVTPSPDRLFPYCR